MVGISLTDFSKQIHQLMPDVLRGFVRLQSNEICKGQVTLPQLFVLESLDKEGPEKMTALALAMRVTTAAMTGIVQRLVCQGYALRGYDDKDRRVIIIGLTPKGSNLLKRINEQRKQIINKVFSQMSEDDRMDYLRIMTKVNEIIKKEVSK